MRLFLDASEEIGFRGTPDLVETRMVPLHALVVLIAALTAISSAGVLVSAMPAMDAWAIAWWRMLGTALILSPLLRRLPRSEWGPVSIAGLFLALHFALWFMSLQRIPVMRSTLLVTLAPIWAGIVEWTLLKRAPHRMFWFGLVLALPGVLWMSGGGDLGAQDRIGDGLALCGGITGALYFVIGGEVRKRVGVLVYMSGVTMVAALCLSVALFFESPSIRPATMLEAGLLVGLIAGPQLIGHNGLNYVLKFLPASVVTATTLLEPVGAALLAFAVLAQVPSIYEVTGGVVVLVGVSIATWPRDSAAIQDDASQNTTTQSPNL